MKSRAGPGGCVNPSALDLEQIIQMGDVVAWPQGMGEPLGLTSQLVEQRSSLPNIEVFLGISFGVPMLPDYAEKWSFRALNAAGQNRRLAAAGALDIIPSPISAVPELIRSGVIKVDVAFIRARRHTDNGYVTTGVVSDYTRALIEGARCVVAEIDERLPMTSHDALTPINSIDYWVEPAHEQVLIPDPVPTPAERAVAACVAEFIPDRATVQVGIGGIPAAVVQALSGHADLGIHSGSLSDAVADLVEGGVITNAYKGIDEGVSVTGCLLGSERLVAFADSNPELAMRSADYTHSLAVMSSIKMLYSINGAIEVDLSGQVNAEQAGNRYLGAIGGQPDFVRGALASPHGRSVIALPSTTQDGRTSRIVPTLEGRPVTTPRCDVDAFITEFGVAELRGRSLSERAQRLISIAHPDFREDLERQVHNR